MPEISKTADQALAILEHVAEHGPLPTSEIARQLKMHRTVVHRLLATLQQRGFVRRVADGGYVPGIAALRVAQHVEPELLAAARPALESLARRHGETFILTMRDVDDAVQVEQVVGSHHFVRVHLARGFRHPLSRGASGRAILAWLDDDTVERIVAASENPPTLAGELAQVRRQGYATSHDELSPGVHGVSAPIVVDDRPTASLGVVFPALRAEKAQTYGQLLTTAAKAVARELSRRLA